MANSFSRLFSAEFYGRKTLRRISFITVCMFLLNIYILPSAFALTVKEQAGDRKAAEKGTIEETLKKVDKKENRIQEPSETAREVSFESHAGKDPRLACILSLMIPGGGHIYLRRDLKGIGFCVATGASYAAAGYFAYDSFLGDSASGDLKTRMVLPGLFFLVSIIIHTVGIVEAYADAEKMNRYNNAYDRGCAVSPYVAKIVVE